MTNPDIEVGQVWQDGINTREVLKVLQNGRIACYFLVSSGDGIASMPVSSFTKGYHLIKSADGTPVKQWREIDPHEGMIAVGQNKGPIQCRVKGSVPSDAVVNEWTLAELVYVEDGDYPFVTAEGDFKYCQIEVNK